MKSKKSHKKAISAWSYMLAHSIYLEDDEVREIIKALEKVNGGETELGNDLKLYLAGRL